MLCHAKRVGENNLVGHSAEKNFSNCAPLDYKIYMSFFSYIYNQELMSAAKRREGASNYRTLFVPSSVESRTLNFG